MNGAQDPLSQLRDIHLPDPVSYWPPAPGWWLLLLLVLALLATAWFAWRRLKRPNLRKAALQELEIYTSGTSDDQALQDQYIRLSILLRRLAISIFGNKRVAGLTGERWLGFLDETGGTDFFTSGPGRSLATVPYAGKPAGQFMDQESAADTGEDDTNAVPEVTLMVEHIRMWVVKNT